MRRHGAALSASKFRRGAARQSAATSVAAFLVNCSSTKGDIYVPGTYTQILRSGQSDTRAAAVQAWSGFSAAWCPQRRSRHAKPHAQQQLARDLEVDYESFLALLVNCSSTKLHTSFECYNQRGYIRTWYVYQHFLFDFSFDEICRHLPFFTLGRSFYA